jgi:hypothetical protein
MSLPEPSNEQKLTYIYQTLKAQEARRKRTMFMKTLKWILYISIIYFLYTYQEYVINTVYTYTKETFNREIRRVSEEQKAGILKGIQQLLPDPTKMQVPSVEPSKTNTNTGAKASTGTSAPPKKK